MSERSATLLTIYIYIYMYIFVTQKQIWETSQSAGVTPAQSVPCISSDISIEIDFAHPEDNEKESF